MQKEKKYWEGYLNGDDADAFIAFTEYINCQDFRFGGPPDTGFAKQLESNGSTVEIQNPNLPVGPLSSNITIGIAYDYARRRVIFFTVNTVGENEIWCYDYIANKIYEVLQDAQVVGGLRFDERQLIHSARVENGNVYWVNGIQNEPRRINIDAGIKLNDPSYVTTVAPYTSPLNQAVISWIRRQPGLPPVQTKIYQTAPVITANQIALDAFTFSYRYVYRDYELSTLSGQSSLANFNADGDLFNRIDVAIPTAEHIDQDVIQVDLVAQYLQSGVFFVIHSWKKNIPADAAAIAAHNNIVMPVPLTYSFYNDQVGIALDSAYSVKPFDSVPIYAQTMEMVKNRSFLANYTIGYTTPIVTSLAIAPTSKTFPAGSIGTFTGEWFLLKYLDPLFPKSAYVLRTTVPFGPLAPHPFYYYTWSGIAPPFPLTLNQATLTYRGYDAHTTATAINGSNTIFETLTDQSAASVITGASTGTTSFLSKVFKSDASFQVSISFKDFYGRECGILTNSSLVLYAPDTGLSTSTYVIALNWMLSNAAAVNEIPDFAFYYSVNVTKCLRTRFFIQFDAAFIYAAKDTSGNYTFTTNTYAPGLAGVAIDLTSLSSQAQGYLFTLGDIAKIFVNGNLYSLSIIAQVAQFVVCQLMDVGSLSSVSGKVEIYTPYKRQSNEPYFEVAQIYPVVNPGTPSKMYSTLTGTLNGDTYLLKRINSLGDFAAEAMNINDKFYLDWFTDAGRPNFVDDIGQVKKVSSIAFSNTFIPGSQNNGLSTYDALDTSDISPDFGPIQKLQLSSKVSKIGTVMLAICSGPTTASIYLGENTLISQTGDAVIAQANTVIGSVHELKGDFGTLNPESVVELRGNIYWFDVQNAKVIQYADNGLFAISNYKTSRFWKLFSDQYKSLTADQIEALGSRPFVFATADPHHGELLFTVPNTLATPPMGFLPDYNTIPYPFDIWDGIGKTMVYKLYAEPNRWQGSYSYTPEYSFYLENNLFSFKAGKLYLHNQQSSYCNYYGVQYQPKIMFLSNQQLNSPKSYNIFSTESLTKAAFVYFMSRYPYIQSSDLVADDFIFKEGIFYSTIYRNKLDPAFSQFAQALIAGEKMRTTALYVMAQWDASAGIVQVKFCNIGYTVSLGQPV